MWILLLNERNIVIWVQVHDTNLYRNRLHSAMTSCASVYCIASAFCLDLNINWLLLSQHFLYAPHIDAIHVGLCKYRDGVFIMSTKCINIIFLRIYFKFINIAAAKIVFFRNIRSSAQICVRCGLFEHFINKISSVNSTRKAIVNNNDSSNEWHWNQRIFITYDQ